MLKFNEAVFSFFHLALTLYGFTFTVLHPTSQTELEIIHFVTIYLVIQASECSPDAKRRWGGGLSHPTVS